VSKRDVLPDPIYSSKLVTRLINKIMLDGKRGTAQTILYSAFKKIETKPANPPWMFSPRRSITSCPKSSLKSAASEPPTIKFRPKSRLIAKSLRFTVVGDLRRLRNEKTMEDKLANEIIDAANGTGASVKKREDTHKMAEANKAYSHYRW
jgi:small subunit ribosomal protein S7